MIAAAMGRRRIDPIEDLLEIRLGVRIDQPGSIMRDFQTAKTVAGKSMPLSHRYYLQDAVFVVGIEGDYHLLSGMKMALENPVFPLYLGRRSCPLGAPLAPKIVESELYEALIDEPWHARKFYKKKFLSPSVNLEIVLDAQAIPANVSANTTEQISIQDIPQSFNPEHRQFAWRSVCRTAVAIPIGIETVVSGNNLHDPLAHLGGS